MTYLCFFKENFIEFRSLGFNHQQIAFLNKNGIETNQYGGVVVDENMQTTRKGIFAGGDAVRGADLAVNVALDGREAAMKMAAYIHENVAV